MQKQYVVLILDGAADLTRKGGRTPLQIARKPHLDAIAAQGICGLMETLYDDLSKGSIVAQLGMLGFDPHKYYPNGRASCEALALGISLKSDDLAFRANFVLENDGWLISYNAEYIKSDNAAHLVKQLHTTLGTSFSEFELYHNSDFRNTLIMRGAGISPRDLICAEPHEEMNQRFDFSNLIKPRTASAISVATRLNDYISAARSQLTHQKANAIFPWSCSSAIELPRFSLLAEGGCTFIGHMDFLHGIASACGVEFIKIGNGDWDTDYRAKGRLTVDLLNKGRKFVLCHINAPDEASHMGDFDRKVYALEQIDAHIAGPVLEYFNTNSDRLGAIAIAPDHYTNTVIDRPPQPRTDVHSKDLVPFAICNGADRDDVRAFDEDSVAKGGRHSRLPINHLDFLPLVRGVNRADQ